MSEPKRYALMGNPWEVVEHKNGNLVSYEDYARLKKQYDDLEYCRGHVPYAQHRSAVDKWTELFHKTADNFDKVVAENARLKAEVERLTKAGDAMIDEWWLQLSCPQKMKASWLKEQAIVDWHAAKEGKQP